MNKIQRQNLIIISLLFAVFTSCKMETGDKNSKDIQPKSQVYNLEFADVRSGEIVKNAIASMGGWNQWNSKNNVSYTKTIKHLDSLGNEIKMVSQKHIYQLRPTFKAAIIWKEDGNDFKIVNTGKKARKLQNGKIMEDEESVNSAWNASFGSHYVMCMPFKLADPGTVLTYEGIDTLPNKKAVHSIRAIYKKGAGSAAGMHTWWYYFNTDNYQPEANFLDYGNGFSYTSYESFQEIGGVKMNMVRNSYRATANKDVDYLSTIYTNSDVRFDEDLPKDLFEIHK